MNCQLESTLRHRGKGSCAASRRAGNVASIRTLLARLNLAAENGTTPLAMAAGYGQTDIVRTLFAAGADTYRKLRDGTTILDLAVAGVGTRSS